jgi:hypothetical protein
MANVDYIVRGSGLICPVANLLGSVNPAADTLFIGSYRSQNGLLPAIGGAAMINDEIVKVTAITLDSVTILRGCADTVPASHAAGSLVWFLNDRTGYANREYMASETVGVKVLMKTTGGSMGPENAPPNTLTFNSRFARPYPPGKVLVGTDAFYLPHQLDPDNTALSLSWTHRDRITQADVLVDHQIASIGPEAGTTYGLRLRNAADTVVATITGITDAAATFTLWTAMTGLGITDADAPVDATLELFSMRGGFESWQSYRMPLRVIPGALIGWGANWGSDWGG